MQSIPLSRRSVLALGMAATVGGCLGSREGDPGSPSASDGTHGAIGMTDNHTSDRPNPSGLHQPLGGLEQAENVESFSERHNLTIDDGTVRVIIELEPGRELPEEYVVSVEDRYGRRIRGYVRIADLSELAVHEAVRAVRPPEPAEPMDQ